MIVAVAIRLVDARTGRELAKKAPPNLVYTTGKVVEVNGGRYKVVRIGEFDDALGAVTVWLSEEK